MNKQEIIKHVLSFIHGGMSEYELSYLYNLCIDKDVLELGCMVGMSSYVIASVAKSVSCVDLWSDTQEHLAHDPRQAEVYKMITPYLPNMFESFNTNCKEFIESGKIKMYRGNTQDLSHNFADKQFDVVIIDADHSYQGVSADFALYHSKVKSDGYIIFHDWNDSMWTGIRKFCDEMIEKEILVYANNSERLAAFKLR